MIRKADLERPHQKNLTTLPKGTYLDAEVPNLYFVVEGDSRYFTFRFKIGNERPWMRLGTLKEGVTLAKAREDARRLAYDLKRHGIDPRAKRNATRDGVNFKVWCDENLPDIVSHYGRKEQMAWSRAIAQVPALHKLQLHAITVEDVEAALKPIWTQKPLAGRKAQLVLRNLFKIAKARKLFAGDNPADWKDGLKDRAVLKPTEKLHETKHHPSLPFAQVPVLMLDLHYDPAASARVLEIIILCAGRSQEVRRMEVRELDLDAGRWTIPKGKMKARKQHVVALPPRVVELLRVQLRTLPPGAQYVFPSDDAKGANDYYGSSGILAALYRRKLLVDHYGEQKLASVHGMRASFRKWCNKTPVLPQMQREAAEFALAHKVGTNTEGSYSDTLEDERLPLMAAWAEHCLSLVPVNAPKAQPVFSANKVVQLRHKAA